MARSKRTNYAKANIWWENMKADVEGPIAGVAVELFRGIPDIETSAAALEALKTIHQNRVEKAAKEAQE